MNWHDFLSGLIAGTLTAPVSYYVSGFLAAWREDRSGRVIYTFRTTEKLGALRGWSRLDNPWGGFLITDRVVSAEQGEILRAAVERYRNRVLWLPHDGDRFELKDGELVKL